MPSSFFTVSSCSASSLFCSTCAQLPVKLSPEPSLALPLSRSLSRSFVLGARWCHVVAHPFVRRPKLDVFFFGTLLLPSASRSLGSASQFGLRLNVHAAVFSGCWCFSKYPPVSKTGTHHLTELPLIKTCRLWSMQRCRASQWANTSPGRNCLNMSITFLSWHQVCECPLAIGLEQTGVAAPQRQVTMLKCYSQAICFYKHHPIFWNILVVYEVSKPTVCIYIYIYFVFFQPLTRSCGCTDLNPSASWDKYTSLAGTSLSGVELAGSRGLVEDVLASQKQTRKLVKNLQQLVDNPEEEVKLPESSPYRRNSHIASNGFYNLIRQVMNKRRT